MAALGWLLNLGFAGGGEPVVPPATTAGGGRRERLRPPRFSRAMSYFEPIRQERKKLVQQARQEIERLAIDLAEKEQLQINEARRKAREALLLASVVNQARDTEASLQRLITGTRLQQIKAKKHLERIKQAEEAAIIAILMASETYEV